MKGAGGEELAQGFDHQVRRQIDLGGSFLLFPGEALIGEGDRLAVTIDRVGGDLFPAKPGCRLVDEVDDGVECAVLFIVFLR